MQIGWMALRWDGRSIEYEFMKNTGTEKKSFKTRKVKLNFNIPDSFYFLGLDRAGQN